MTAIDRNSPFLMNLLRRNKRSHSDLYERKHEGDTFDCDRCDYQCSKQYSLKEHKLNIHKGVTHNCDQCENQVPTKHNLRRHKLTKHEEVTTCVITVKR